MSITSNIAWTSNNWLKQMSESELWAEFRKAISYTAEGFRRMAEIWVELRDRGGDMLAFQNPITAYLPAIAHGELDPVLVARYANQAVLMNHLATLAPAEQRRLALDAARITVVTLTRNGEPPVTRDMRPADMTVPQMKLVFADGKIRSVAEQAHHFVPPKARLAAPDRAADVKQLFDLLGLTKAQRADLTLAAAKIHITPAQFVVRDLVSRKLIRDAGG